MIENAEKYAKTLPKYFIENVNKLLNSIGSNIDDVEINLKNIIKNLEDIL